MKEVMVGQFHRAFNVGDGDDFKTIVQRRIKLLREELDEFEEALTNHFNKCEWNVMFSDYDVPFEDETFFEMLSELVDLQYVLSGTVDELGLYLYFDEAFIAVHNNNMSKLWEDGKPRFNEYGKVIKPDNFKKVDLMEFFNGRR